MEKTRPLTDAQIKYLAVLHELDAEGNGIRSIEIVRHLGISRPSVHSMLERLAGRGLVQKDYYGIVYLTEEGIREAGRCAELYHAGAAGEAER
ncbi:MAG: helix-turn-helix domain-containing protein [Solobacterium sp.]|nr:helix-turn-helix domain-containing protein [Solobacterium sp.]